MGKPEVLEIGISAAETAAAASADVPYPCIVGIRKISSVRCVIVLFLTIGVLISAIFWIVPISSFRSGFVPDDADAASAEIQACFILQKPSSLLTLHAKRLEYDILEDIGVPNAKVSIISMHPTASIKSTSVAFGVLPEPRHASISLPALSLLRSSLIELVLQQINLTLTPSIFGETLSFEVLKFPGGITVIPIQTSSIWERTKALFNFTVCNSIDHIQENMNELKDQLKLGLHLRPYENVYVQMTNVNGSTITPPVTLQASILSDYGSGTLLPNRLKQLADIITGSHAYNLGLNHSVFGEVKSVVLTSYLNNLISSLEPSSPSPSPSPSPIATPYSPFEECSHHTSSLSACKPSIDQDDLQPPCLFCENLSRTLSHASDHRIGSQPAYSSNTAAPNPSPHKEYKSPRLITQSAHAVFVDSTLPVQDKESIKASSMLSDSLPVSSLYTYGVRAQLHDGAFLMLTAVTLAWVLLSAL